MTDKEKKKLFDDKEDMSQGLIIIGFGFIAVAILAWVRTSWTNEFVDATDWQALTMSFVMFFSGLALGVYGVSSAIVRSIRRCLVLAEKYEIPLTPYETFGLNINCFTVEAVYLKFIKILEERRPDLIDEGWFPNGKKFSHCRALINYLWKQEKSVATREIPDKLIVNDDRMWSHPTKRPGVASGPIEY